VAVYIPLSPFPIQAVDANGSPLVGGTIEFYLSGTTTPANLFSDSAGTSIGTSVTLNSLGYPASGGNVVTLFRNTAVNYKLIAKTALGVTIWTADTLNSVLTVIASVSASEGASLVGIQDAANNYTATTVEGALAEIYSDLASTSASLGASLVGIQDSGAFFTAATVEAALAELHTSGSYTGTFTGCTTEPTVTINYRKTGLLVVLSHGQQSGTSNATSFTITGMPAAIRPTVSRAGVMVAITENSTIQIGRCTVQTDGVIAYSVGMADAIFTASGSKGVRANTFAYCI
jgi:hypothetical protein